MTETPRQPRRHDLDALRAIAMLLGIALHAALSFMPVPWPVQDERQSESFGLFVAVIHGFRMPLFFLVSGFFTAMLLQKRGWRSVAAHRFRRIFLPLLLAAATILPLTAWVSDRVATEPSDEDARDVLHYVSAAGQTEALRSLLDGGADPNSRSAEGSTLLHGAAFFGRPGSVALLLSRGADPQLTDANGATPLEVTEAGWELTQAIADLVNIPVGRKAVEEGREEAAALLSGKVAAGDVVEQTAALQFLRAPLLGHLWFLWHLCWLVAGFLLCAGIVKWLLQARDVRFPRNAIVSPLRILWLVPITAVAQAAMTPFLPAFGPDTSISLLPDFAVLGYYAIFFFFGALYFLADDREGVLGRRWWLQLPIALCVVFPIGLHFVYAGESFLGAARRPLAALVQVTYAWLMVTASIGIFRKFVASENPSLRYVSDASYWLYLAHIPVVIAAQALVRDWPLPAFLKFVFVCVAVTGTLLATYQWCVRYTWLGTLLNGPRTRPPR